MAAADKAFKELWDKIQGEIDASEKDDAATKLLLADLEGEIKACEDSKKKESIQNLLNDAKSLMFHDFHSEKVAPKMELLSRSKQLGLEKIFKNTLNGIYDN